MRIYLSLHVNPCALCCFEVFPNLDACQCLISFTEYTTHPDVQVILHVDSDDASRISLPFMTDMN